MMKYDSHRQLTGIAYLYNIVSLANQIYVPATIRRSKCHASHKIDNIAFIFRLMLP